MAKTYEEFKKQFAAMELKLKQMDDTLDSNRSVAQTQVGLAERAAAAIGSRVRTLREGGAVGNVVADFQKDAEVQKYVTYIQTVQATNDKAVAAMLAARNTAKPVVQEKQTLVAALTAEIAARKKDIIKSKSLPDMEKLLIAVKALSTMECQAKPPPDKDFTSYIPAEIEKSKNVAAEEEKDELEERRLDERIVATRRATVAGRLKELLNSVTKAVEAQTAKSAKDMQTHKAAAKLAADEINKIVNEYTDLAAKWRSAYMGTKAGPKIDTMINEMKTMLEKAKAAWAKLPKDWKPAVPTAT